MRKLLVVILVFAGLALVVLSSAAAGPVVDELIYSTYLGSDADEQGRGVALDDAGRAYVTGYTSSTVFPAPRAGRSPDHGVDVYAARFDPAGASTEYLFWFNALALFKEDEGYSVAIDGQGNAYVTGYTRSEDFCAVFGVVPGYHTSYYGETDAFVLKIRADGSGLDYCTFLGGADWDAGRAITVDAAGNAYIIGGTWSEDFPTTPGAAQSSLAGLRDVFLARLDASGTALTYSSYFGGAGQEEGTALAVAFENGGAGEILYAIGWSNSSDLPVTAGALGSTYSGNTDGFVLKLDLGSNALGYSTYLGGSEDDRPTAVTVANLGQALVAGYTQSTDFPTTPGALSAVAAGGVDGFVTSLAADGASVAWSTFLGGTADDLIWAAAEAGAGAIVVAGETSSADFPTTPAALFPSLSGTRDAFVAKINGGGSTLAAGTYLGGSSTDRAYGLAAGAAGDVVVTGITGSDDFPTTPQAFDTEYNGSGDVFVTRLSLRGAVPPRARAWLPMVRRALP